MKKEVEIQEKTEQLSSTEVSTEPNRVSTEPLKVSTEAIQEPVNGFKVPKGEEDFVHVRISKGNRFDPNTGKELVKPSIKVYGKREWKSIEASMQSLGFQVEVLHKPNF